MRTRTALLLLFLALLAAPVAAQQPERDGPGPIPANQSLWTEELTWWEIRDLMEAGYRTVIIGTGGVEQNGPWAASGKHNYVLQTVLPYIARAIPNSLIAPVVKFVPEGRIEPTGSGHMSYPGTISVEAETYQRLVTDIARSYKTHGFRDIILLGDSGGNQGGLQAVAEALNERWSAEGSDARVHFLPEYYRDDQWSYEFLKARGMTQVDTVGTVPPERAADTRNGMHTDIYYEAQMAVQNPTLVHAQQRIAMGDLSLHGVKFNSVEELQSVGMALAEYRAGVTARAFQASMQRLRGR